MYEIEVKSPVERTRDPARMDEVSAGSVEALLERGAVLKGSKDQKDIYLVHPCRDLASTDESVRIRVEEKEGMISVRATYKGPKVSERSKTRTEIEMAVSEDPDIVESFFAALGFSRSTVVRKRRVSMELSGTVLCIDSVEGLGVFIEAERMGEDVPGVESEVLELMGSLGFEEQERRSYLEMLLGR